MPGEVRPLSPRLSDDLNAHRQSILVKAARDAYRRKTVVICKDCVVCCKCLRVGAGHVDFWNRTSCRWKEQHVNVFECWSVTCSRSVRIFFNPFLGLYKGAGVLLAEKPSRRTIPTVCSKARSTSESALKLLATPMRTFLSSASPPK